MFIRLVDLCCPLPGLPEETHLLRAAADSPDFTVNDELYQSRLSALRKRVILLLDTLESWKAQWQTAVPPKVWIDQGIHAADAFPEHLFGRSLRFRDIFRAKIYVWFNLGYYMLATIEASLPQDGGRIADALDCQEDTRDPQAVRKTAASAICCSLPYMLDFSTHGSSGALQVKHILIDILPAYEDDSDEFKWIAKKLQEFPKHFGLDAENVSV